MSIFEIERTWLRRTDLVTVGPFVYGFILLLTFFEVLLETWAAFWYAVADDFIKELKWCCDSWLRIWSKHR